MVSAARADPHGQPIGHAGLDAGRFALPGKSGHGMSRPFVVADHVGMGVRALLGIAHETVKMQLPQKGFVFGMLKRGVDGQNVGQEGLRLMDLEGCAVGHPGHHAMISQLFCLG